MRSVAVFVLIALSVQAYLPLTAARAVEPAPPPGKDLVAYHIGNSLTRCIPLERLAQLFEAAGGSYDYGMQLGGGHRLEQHLSMRNHGNRPGEGRYNTVKPYGTWDHAFGNYRFDAVILQPYKGKLDQEPQVMDHWPWFSAGDLQAASGLIDYARARTRPGEGRWDREHANTTNVAADRFYIYATWPGAGDILAQEEKATYANYWDDQYAGDVQACRDFYDRLVTQLNERHTDLPVPVRMIPVGEVLARLDERIRSGQLPGIEDFYERNQSYFIKSRRNNKNPPPFDPDEFVRRAGVLNFYADGVHMNDQPHNGQDSGTIGSYVSALTHYATLTGESPVGLTTEPYEQFDPERDVELIRALQQTVWEVVSTHPHTGVSRPASGSANAGIPSANPRRPGVSDEGVEVSGVVCDTDGQPVEGVWVRLEPMGGPEYTTNSEGRFSAQYKVNNAPPGCERVYVLASWPKRGQSKAVALPAGEPARLDMVLEPGVHVRGHLVDGAGEPISDARLVPRLCDVGWSALILRALRGQTDREGEFRVGPLPAGCFYEIRVRAEGGIAHSIELDTFRPVPETLDLGRLVLERCDRVVSGTVIDTQGNPVAGAKIRISDSMLRRWAGTSGDDGSFSVEMLPDDRLFLMASVTDPSQENGHKVGTMEVGPAENEVRVTALPATRACPVLPEPESRVGQRIRISDLRRLGLNVERSDLNGKSLLVALVRCIPHPNCPTRESRQCLRKLAAAGPDLAEEGFAILAVQVEAPGVSTAPDGVVDGLRWIEGPAAPPTNPLDRIPEPVALPEIQFPVGVCRLDRGALRTDWGVSGTPWILVTDKSRVVTQEGDGVPVLRRLLEDSAPAESPVSGGSS